MQPISQKKEAQFRGPTSSQNFNEWMGDSYYDLVQLFNFAADYGVKIPENMQMLVIENVMLQKRVNELQSIVDNIEQTSPGEKILLHSFASDGNLSASPGYPALEQDTDYGLLKVPHLQEISKLYLVNLSNENFVPQSLKTKVYESTAPFDVTTTSIEGTDIIDDSKLVRIFDGDKSSFWLKKSVYPSTVNEVYFCLEIELPTNIINHTRANIITIDPTPLSSLTLLDIEYKSVDWQRLETYPVINVSGQVLPKDVSEMGRMKFCFPTRDVVAVRIYGKQSNWFLENGKRSFYYGFRNVDINYMSFRTEEFRLQVQFDIPNPTKQFVSIQNADPVFPVLPVFADGSVTAPELLHVYKIYVGGREFNFGEILPALTKSVMIEIGMDLTNEISPLLSGLIIKYESA